MCSRDAQRSNPASRARFWRPSGSLDLVACQPDERVAVPQRVVEERERMLTRQRHEPQRQLRQIDGDRVLIHAVQAALGHQPAGEDDLVLVGRDGGHAAVDLPRLDEPSASWRHASTRNAPEPIAGSQTLRSRICSGAAGRRRPKPLEDRRERRAHDRLGERARRVVGARAPALLARLQDHRPGGTMSGVASRSTTGSSAACSSSSALAASIGLLDAFGVSLRSVALLEPLLALRRALSPAAPRG